MTNYFSKILYMNLDTEKERKEQIETELERVGLEAERITAIDGRTYDEEGKRTIENNENGLLTTYDALCESLLIAFRRAKTEGWKNFLILEDDAVFSEDFTTVLDSIFEKKIRQIEVDDETKPLYSFDPMTLERGEDIIGYEKKTIDEEWSDLPDNCDIITLGFKNGQFPVSNLGGRVYKLRQFSLGQALGFFESVYDRCIESLERKDQPSDICFSDIGFNDLGGVKVCGVMKGIVTQRAGFSSCIGREVKAKAVS